MRITNELNLHRLAKLIKNTLAIHRKLILMTLLTMTLIMAMLPYILSGSLFMYFVMLYGGGFVVTSYAFNDMHAPNQAFAYLMLPCSNLERFLSKWFLTSIGYALATLLFFYLFSLINASLHLYMFPRLFLFFQPIFWTAIFKYICLQSLFLLGAISFRKYSFIKTSLVISVALFALFASMFLIVWLVMGNITHLHGNYEFTLFKGGLGVLYYAFWPALAITCWYLTYRKITNYELR